MYRNFYKFIFIFMLLMMSNIYAANDTSAIKKLFKKFQNAWNSKNYKKVDSCLYKPVKKQKEAYKLIDRFLDKVSVNIEVEDIRISLPYARVTVKIKRNFVLKGKKEDDSIIKREANEKEEILHYMLYKNRKSWKILGTIEKPKLFGEQNKTAEKTGSKNKLNNNNISKSGNTNTTNVNFANMERIVHWYKMPNAIYYNIILSKENPVSSNGESLYKEKNIENSYIIIPNDIYNKMQENQEFYLIVEGYDTNNNKVGMYLLKIKRGKK